MAIQRFRGPYYPFSNMYVLPRPVPTDCGIDVPTSEHAYMANRFRDHEIQRVVAETRAAEGDTRAYADGVAAKEIAHAFIEAGVPEIFSDDFARVSLMRRVVALKLERNPEIMELLLSTGTQQIEEGNEWGDRFWGVSPVGSGTGHNHLGRIYMELRKESA